MAAINLKTNSSPGSANVHLLPCNIDHDGTTDVSQYFHGCNSSPDEKGVMKGSFRGRSILGKVFDVPKGFQGVIVNEKGIVCSDQQQRTVEVGKQFEQMTYWNLETKPTASDTIMNAFDWFEAASVLHAPVTCSGLDGVEGASTSTPPDR